MREPEPHPVHFEINVNRCGQVTQSAIPFQKNNRQPHCCIGDQPTTPDHPTITRCPCVAVVCLLLSFPAEDLPPILDQFNQQLPQPLREWVSGRQQFGFVLRQILRRFKLFQTLHKVNNGLPL